MTVSCPDLIDQMLLHDIRYLGNLDEKGFDLALHKLSISAASSPLKAENSNLDSMNECREPLVARDHIKIIGHILASNEQIPHMHPGIRHSDRFRFRNCVPRNGFAHFALYLNSPGLLLSVICLRAVRRSRDLRTAVRCAHA